jgi:membrane protease YdiL (CAAX protease family)
MGVESESPASAIGSLPALTTGNVALALLGLPLFASLVELTDTDVPTTTVIGVYWATALAVTGIAVWGEDLSLTDLGFRRPEIVDLASVLATAVAILAVYAGTTPLVESLGLQVSEGTSAVGAGVGIGVALVHAVTIGVVEEVLYRGYPIERLLAHTESPLVAGGVTWLAFTIVHALNWPVGTLLQTAIVAAVLTVVYLRRRSLVPVVGAHVLVWVFSVIGQYYG